MPAIKPYQQVPEQQRAAATWIRRRTFIRILRRMLGLSDIDITPRLRISQTPSGLAITARANAAAGRVPFAVSLSGFTAEIAPGVVSLPGGAGPFVMSGDVPVSGSGCVCIRALMRLPMWLVQDPHIYGDFAGWVTIEEEPTFDFIDAADPLFVQPAFGSIAACEPIPLQFPLAFVDASGGRVVQLHSGAISVRFRRTPNDIWPDLAFGIE